MERETVRLKNPTELAFVGDAVFELLVREHLATSHPAAPAAMHRTGVEYVCARSQRQFLGCIEDLLDEEESAVVRRGRNASRVSVPRNTEPLDYRLATGLEALFGYLFLLGRGDRIRQLFARIVERHDTLFPCPGAARQNP